MRLVQTPRACVQLQHEEAQKDENNHGVSVNVNSLFDYTLTIYKATITVKRRPRPADPAA